jgi:hypothetical protein
MRVLIRLTAPSGGIGLLRQRRNAYMFSVTSSISLDLAKYIPKGSCFP